MVHIHIPYESDRLMVIVVLYMLCVWYMCDCVPITHFHRRCDRQPRTYESHTTLCHSKSDLFFSLAGQLAIICIVDVADAGDGKILSAFGVRFIGVLTDLHVKRSAWDGNGVIKFNGIPLIIISKSVVFNNIVSLERRFHSCFALFCLCGRIWWDIIAGMISS